MDDMTDDVVLPKPEPEDPPAKKDVKEERRGAANIEVIERVKKLIFQKSPYFVARYREIMQSETHTSQGMTHKQINERFQVPIAGDENYAQLRMKAAQVNTLRNEAAGYLRELEAKHLEGESVVEAIKTDLNEEIVSSNQTLGRTDRISDKAREAIVNQVYAVDGIGIHMARVNADITLWKSVVRDLDKTLETIETNLQSLASENKYDFLGRQPGMSQQHGGQQ